MEIISEKRLNWNWPFGNWQRNIKPGNLPKAFFHSVNIQMVSVNILYKIISWTRPFLHAKANYITIWNAFQHGPNIFKVHTLSAKILPSLHHKPKENICLESANKTFELMRVYVIIKHIHTCCCYYYYIQFYNLFCTCDAGRKAEPRELPGVSAKRLNKTILTRYDVICVYKSIIIYYCQWHTHTCN